MPIFGGKKTLWKIKELTKYERRIEGSEIPPIYDLEKLSAIHQEIDANLRPFWENLHPIVQDFITAWSNSLNSLLREKEELNAQIRQKANLISNLKSNFESKLRELNSIISSLKSEIQAKEAELAQKEDIIKELESLDKENKLGISQLRETLENRLKEMNEKMAERQKKYEETQMQVGHAFQQKVLELDSEMQSLRDQLAEKDAKLKEQAQELELLKKESQKVPFYESKIKILEKKLNQIAEILEVENEEVMESD
ncbi:MAG: hypothetical protein ACTSRS_14230 [Candidatus Helarchaeota archaeon]